MPLTRIDLEEIANIGCRTGCNKQERLEVTENDLCKDVYSILDKLPVRCVGKWSVQKIYLLYQYFGIFTIGMKNKWKEINYIEICSGPGRCISREMGTEFNGTALSIIKHPAYQYLHKALFFDFNQIIVETLNKRIEQLNVSNSKAIIGDYNKPDDICERIKAEIGQHSLNLILIDPTDCSIPFNLIRQLKEAVPNIDFIINIAIGSDYNRNIKDLLINPKKFSTLLKKYSRFIDSTDFFYDAKIISYAKQGNQIELRNALREAYITNLKSIGYENFRYNRIENYYDILFATAHKKGTEFWDKANKYKHDGQSTMNFEQ